MLKTSGFLVLLSSFHRCPVTVCQLVRVSKTLVDGVDPFAELDMPLLKQFLGQRIPDYKQCIQVYEYGVVAYS